MGSGLAVGLCYSRIREDERLLLAEFESRGHAVERVDVRDPRFGLDGRAGTAEIPPTGRRDGNEDDRWEARDI